MNSRTLIDLALDLQHCIARYTGEQGVTSRMETCTKYMYVVNICVDGDMIDMYASSAITFVRQAVHISERGVETASTTTCKSCLPLLKIRCRPANTRETA